MGTPTPLASSIEEIVRTGDTLDAHKRLFHNTAAMRLVAANAAAVGILAGTSDVATPGDVFDRAEVLTNAFSYPAFGLAATVLAGALYGYSRLRDRSKIRTAERRQDVARKILGEPVDVIRVRENGKYVPLIRWYGLESSHAEPTAAFTVGRLQKLLSATADVDAHAFVFSSRALSDLVDVASGKFGSVVPSTDQYNIGRVEVKSDAADPEVIVATRGQCEAIVAELKQQLGSDVIERLAGMVRAGDPRSRIPATVRRVDLATRAGLLQLNRELNREARDLATDAVGGPETVRYVDDHGIPRTARASATVTIAGGDIRVDHSYHDNSGGARSVREHGGSLLAVTGHSSEESLIEALTRTPPRGRFRYPAARATGAKVALLLMTRRLLETKGREIATAAAEGRHRGGAPQVASLATDSPPTTIFQRLVSEPPRTVPRLRSRGRVKRDAEPTLEYRRRGSNASGRRRALLGVGITSFFIFGGYVLPYEAGMMVKAPEIALENAYARDYQRAVADHEIASDYSREDYIAETANPIARVFLSGAEKLKEARDAVDEAALWGVRHAGVSEETIAEVRKWIRGRPEAAAPPPRPGNILTNEWGDVGIGDVSDTKNDSTIFEARGIGGESTAGYWYTGVNDAVVVGLGTHTYPYKNAGISFTHSQGRHEELSLPLTPPSNADSRFEVSGSLSKAWLETDRAESIRLPMRSRTKVAAVRIEDASVEKPNANDDTVISPKISRDATTGTYEVSFMPSSLDKIKEPRLRYWLAYDPGGAVRARGPMQVIDHFADDNFPLRDVVTAEDRARVVRALGLPVGATGAEIRAAIRAKEYSFMPVSDAGRKPTLVVDRKTARAGEILATIAEEYGVLPAEVCNSAMDVMVTATAGEYDGRPINAAVGFLDKGDGKLSTLDSHTWPVDDFGNEWDPTPAVRDATRRGPAASASFLPLGPYVPVTVLVGVGSVALWRRRESLKRFAATALDHYYDARADDETVSDLYEAMTVLGFLGYSRPGTEPPARERYGDDIRELFALHARSVPVPFEVVSEAMSARGVEATPGVRKALRELANPDSRLVRAAARRSATAGRETDAGGARRS